MVRRQGRGLSGRAEQACLLRALRRADAPHRLSTRTRNIVTFGRPAPHEATALLVNTSRAPLIERGALVDALRAGRPGMAASTSMRKSRVRDTRIRCSTWTT